MDRQIGQRYQESSAAALEHRVHVLEGRVTALADVVRVLAHGLEDLPAEPGQRPAAAAARQAYDLLLVAEPPTPGPGAGGGGDT